MMEDVSVRDFPCPCYKKNCKDCPIGFEKFLDLKNAGLVIYRHSIRPERDNQGIGFGSDLEVDKNGFIFHNTKDADIISKDFLPEMENRAVKCARCRQIMEHAVKILQKVSAISKNEIIGLCDHCKLKDHPCGECEGALKKFFESKKEDKFVFTKERVRQWLTSIKSEFKGFLSDKETGSESLKDYVKKYKKTNGKTKRARSEVRINQLCRRGKDRSERELEIRELCRQADELDFARPSPIVTDKSKKQIFDCDDLLQELDPTYTISLERQTKSAIPKTKEQSIGYEDQMYTSVLSKKDKDSKKEERIIKETYSDIPRTKKRDFYADDILPARHPTQYVHDTEKRTSFEEEPIDETGSKTGFIFSFPLERVKEEKSKQEKSSSELIGDIHDRIHEKNEEVKRKIEDERLKKIEEEERKQRAREEKIKLAEEKKRLAEEQKKLEEERKLREKAERDKARLFDKSKDTVSLKLKASKVASSSHEIKQSKSEAAQKEPYLKSKLQVSKSERKEFKMKDKEIKSEAKFKSKPEISSRGPQSDQASSKTEQKRTKNEIEVDSKKAKGELKMDTKQPKPEKIAESKQHKTETQEETKQPKTETQGESKQPKAELKSNSKQPKGEPKSDSKQPIGEPKSDSKQPKGEPKSDSKQPKGEPKSDSKQPKDEPKSDSKQPKSETQAGSKGLKLESKQVKPDAKEESKQRETAPKTVSQGSPKATPKEASESKKSPLPQTSSISEPAEKGPNAESKKSTAESKQPKAETKDSKAESKESKLESKQPKIELKDSKFKADSKVPYDLKGTKDVSNAEKLADRATKEKVKTEKDQEYVKKKTDTTTQAEKLKEKEKTEKDQEYVKKKTDTTTQAEKPKEKEEESMLQYGKDIKIRGAAEIRVPRRQLEAQQVAQEAKKNKSNIQKKELDVTKIQMLQHSQNFTVLDLVKVKDGDGAWKSKRTLSQIMTLSQMVLHDLKHKVLKIQRCPMCINSNLEIEYETRKKRMIVQKDIIKGGRITCVPGYIEEKEEPEIKPLLFQIKYDDKFHAEIIQPPKHIPVVIEYHEEMKPTKTLPEEESKGVIRYALSDRTFIEKGWTMLPTEKVVRKMNVYRMRPAHPEFDWFERNKNKRLMMYDTGERLAEFDDDGRGRWFYKNQRLALQYYDAEELNAQQRFVIYSNGEPDERGRTRPYTILATFDYLGNGIVFDHGGKIRMKYNQTEGVILDRSIGPVSHWKWHTLNDPPVLQQVMIDTYMSHKDPQILKMSTAHNKLPRPDNEEMLAIEFDNFIKEKSKKLSQTFKPFQIRMKALKINEHFSLKVLDQANVYLIYRDGTTNIKLNLGMLLDHKEIVDTDTAEVGEVANNIERLPARTDSLAAMQKSVAYAQHFERNRTERERRLRPLAPSTSADKLAVATSRPLRLPLRAASSFTGTPSSSTKSRKPLSNYVYYDNRLL